jgi:hypothetical protein
MDPSSRVDKFNQLVRGIVTVGLAAGFIYGFVTKLIDPGLYANVFGIIIAFWFATRNVPGMPRSTDGASGTAANGSGNPKGSIA